MICFIDDIKALTLSRFGEKIAAVCTVRVNQKNMGGYDWCFLGSFDSGVQLDEDNYSSIKHRKSNQEKPRKSFSAFTQRKSAFH